MITNRELDLIAADPADLVRLGLTIATEPARAEVDPAVDDRCTGDS